MKRSKSFVEMTTRELAKATADLDREFVADTFGELDVASRRQWERIRKKPGRPRRGRGAKAISVTVEKSLLVRTDRLAKKLKVSRAALIEHGLREVLRHAS